MFLPHELRENPNAEMGEISQLVNNNYPGALVTVGNIGHGPDAGHHISVLVQEKFARVRELLEGKAVVTKAPQYNIQEEEPEIVPIDVGSEAA